MKHVVWVVLLMLSATVALSRQSPDDTTRLEKIASLLELADRAQVNNPEKSVRHAMQALQLAEQQPANRTKVKILKSVGVGYYHLAEYNRALEYHSLSLALSEELGYTDGIADALNNIGVLYYVWGEYDRSLDFYSRTVELRRDIGDIDGLASGLNNLGTVYFATDRHSESRRYFSDALALYEQLGNERLTASTLNNLGLVSHELGEYDRALELLDRALNIEQSIDDLPGQALSLNTIGVVHGSLGDHGKALEYFNQALTVRTNIKDRQGVAASELSIGTAYTESGDYPLAREHLERALELAVGLGVKELESEAYLAISELSELRGRFSESLDAYKQYKSVNDGLFTESTSRRMAELEARYELAKKDQEIQLLTQEREIQRMIRNAILLGSLLLLALIALFYNRHRLKERANKKIYAASEALRVAQEEREESVRAELVHVSRVATMGEHAAALAHELNQPLTAILANAQATHRTLSKGDDRDRDELRGAICDIVDGAKHACGIIERLRELIRRRKIDRGPLDINRTIRQIEAFIHAAADEQGVECELLLRPDLPNALGDRVQIQQVILNLVHNAAEASAGIENAGKIVIESRLEDQNTVIVLVRDAGRGVNGQALDTMFMPFVTTKPDGLGMGLPICATILEAHGGRLWATPNSDRGLTVQFSLSVV